MDMVMYSSSGLLRTSTFQPRNTPRSLFGSLTYVRRKPVTKRRVTASKLMSLAEASRRSLLGLHRVPSPKCCEGLTVRRIENKGRRRRPACALAVELVQSSAQTWSAGGLLEIPLVRDSCALVVALVGAMTLVKGFNYLAAKDYLDRKLSRKLVHLLAGPCFALTWPLFSAYPQARYFAVMAPFLNFLRLGAIGLGLIQDAATVKAVSREGDRSELLRGPLYYTVVLVGATLVYWRESLVGMVTISMMCGGDGLADIVGRRFGSAKLPWNKEKSWAGSIAMFGGGLAMSLGYVALFSRLGYFTADLPVLPVIAFIAMLATLVESLPINKYIDDNISVPLVTAGAGLLLMESVTVLL